MKKIITFCFFFFIFFHTQAEIVVSSASSLQIAMQEIIKQYNKKNTQRVVLNSSASGVLARQIVAGAKVHIFLSANSQWVDFLQEKNLLKKEHKYPLVFNRLVLAKNCSNNQTELLAARKIAVGDFDYVPVGIYAKNYLQKIRYLEKIQEKLVFTNSENQAVSYIQKNLLDMAFIYYSSWKNYKNLCLVKEITSEFPQNIVYQMALIFPFVDKETLLFADFLRAKTALSIFEKYNFGIGIEKPYIKIKNPKK